MPRNDDWVHVSAHRELQQRLASTQRELASFKEAAAYYEQTIDELKAELRSIEAALEEGSDRNDSLQAAVQGVQDILDDLHQRGIA